MIIFSKEYLCAEFFSLESSVFLNSISWNNRPKLAFSSAFYMRSMHVLEFFFQLRLLRIVVTSNSGILIKQGFINTLNMPWNK